MSGDEQAYVADAFSSNWLSSVGPNLDGFFARRSGGSFLLAAVHGHGRPIAVHIYGG